ncbi:MAG: hypothetical protein MI723_13160, partial [Caulobacterales bacterium]|nr:hypothetical protein [Caulobacterales bacterium]
MSGGPASPASGGGAAPDEPEPHVFFDDPTIDALIATITTLTGELSVVRERLDTVERLLERNGAL